MTCRYENQVWENLWCPVACYYCTSTHKELYCKSKKPIEQTVSERIRAMSDEEMADFFAQRDMILLRKALAVFEAEDLIPENALIELRKDMLEALQRPADEG